MNLEDQGVVDVYLITNIWKYLLHKTQNVRNVLAMNVSILTILDHLKKIDKVERLSKRAPQWKSLIF